MVKRKFADEEEFDAYPQPAFKRIAIRTELPGPGQVAAMDVEMDDMPSVHTPSDDDSLSVFTGAYPPTSQTLYPFPVKRDEMDCDEPASSPESSSPLLSKAASDPVHGSVVDNRHPSNASSIAALQPRTRNTSCACSRIPKLILAQYANEDGKRTMWSHCEGCGAMDMVLGCNGQPVVC